LPNVWFGGKGAVMTANLDAVRKRITKEPSAEQQLAADMVPGPATRAWT
jgi:hypothetical protein